MILDEICYLIDSNSTSRTLGTNLFAGFQSPLTPDTATFVQEYSGRKPNFTFGSSTPAWENPRVQILDRSTDYQTARNASEKHYKIIMGQVNVVLKPSSSATGTTYLSLTPINSPFYVGQDSNERHQMAFNIEAMKNLST